VTPGREATGTDAEFIAASVPAGEAFAALFDRHARTLHRYLARRAGVAAAEDLLAQTFLVAFETRDRYDQARADARPWLYGIATNVLRRARRDEVRLYRALARTGVDPDVACPADRVAARVDAAAATAALAGVLAELPARDRDVLLLVGWGGLRQDEVAVALDLPLGTVKSRLHRARSRLRAALPDLGTADPCDDVEERNHG
jgi:RNA polymerase sigma factor (sigma-70 family)